MPPQKRYREMQKFLCSEASPRTLNLIAPFGKSCIGNEVKFAQWAAHCDQYCPDLHEHPKTSELAIQAQRIEISKQYLRVLWVLTALTASDQPLQRNRCH